MPQKHTRKKPGPKPKPASAKRNVLIQIVVRQAEYDELRRRADARLESMSHYLREKGLGR